MEKKMPDLTIFSAPKPFTNPHIALIQRNAILSWINLGPQVEVILIGEEDGLAECAAELGVRHLSNVARTGSGTPLVSAMFELARQNSSSPLLACVNADILLMPDFVQAAKGLAAQAGQFLMVGQRWDLDVRQPLDFSPGWPERLRQDAQTRGKLHRASGSDYFIFPRGCFVDMPAFAIGRAGWDNWMIYAGRRSGWPVVDGTQSIMIVHQNHDYSHLPGGQPHYRHPETFENVRLAGGKRAIFELQDVNRQLVNGRLQPVPFSWAKFWREAEIFPLVTLHSKLLGQIFFALFHPLKAYREFRQPAK
jgi:hypothetical protein